MLRATFHRLSAAMQTRLDLLMTKHNEGQLIGGEHEELRVLGRQPEEITLANAPILVGQP